MLNRMVWTALLIVFAVSVVSFLSFRLLLPAMWNFLVINEPSKRSDVIIVLSGDAGRGQYGVTLYQQGYADKLLFSGGAAQNMRREALAAGIADSHILVDRKSHTTFENAGNSAAIMREQGLESALVVTSAYHTRRSSIIFAQFIPRANLTICAVPTSSNADNWWQDRQVATSVIFEYLKLVYHYFFER